jgi:dTDP-4-dehydrorhamnose reductase
LTGRVVVIGGSGQVGTAFRALLPDAFFPARDELDLLDLGAIGPTLARWEPSAIINCAAYTAVDRAEDDEATATTVNGRAVGELATAAAVRRIPFLTYSTDFVFDGTATRPYVESDPTAPINAYGRSKLAGEREVLRYPGSLVIRTSWVISGTHANFVATMLNLARNRSVRVVSDQLGRPTMAGDLAAASLAALERGATGLLHLTNSGQTSWFDLARRAVEIAGLDSERIEPCTTADYPTPARRPAYSVLGSERRSDLGLPELPSWHDSLPAVVEQLMLGNNFTV